MTDRVLITGIGGYIAKHVALWHLKNGDEVRGTVRSLAKAEAVKKSLQAAGAPIDQLRFVEADLTLDNGWDEAIDGIDYVQHLASPFPLNQPSDREALVPAARDGALKVVKAAIKANVKRIAMTSSIVAMMYRRRKERAFSFTESDWTDPEWKAVTAYTVSKTRAEKSVRDYLNEVGANDRFVSIHPGFVLGPLLDSDYGTSVGVIRLFLKGAYPSVPPVAFPVVDVRDLAQLHGLALKAPVAQRRLIAAGETMSFAAMVAALKEAYPERKNLPSGELAEGLVRFLSLFDKSLGTLSADLGRKPMVDSTYVTELTGAMFRPAKESVIDTAKSLLEYGLIDKKRS
jgi:nucleoside-diphosphate-sugar epimerase